MKLVEWSLLKQPLNYLTVAVMGLIGLTAVSLIAAPLRAAKSTAQA